MQDADLDGAAGCRGLRRGGRGLDGADRGDGRGGYAKAAETAT